MHCPTTESAVQFFYDIAGTSYNPMIETVEAGKLRNAETLAKAEQFALLRGYHFQWEPDQDWCGDLWLCIMYDATGNIVETLGGVDFGEHGKPWGNDNRRLIEAQMAIEQMP